MKMSMSLSLVAREIAYQRDAKRPNFPSKRVRNKFLIPSRHSDRIETYLVVIWTVAKPSIGNNRAMM